MTNIEKVKLGIKNCTDKKNKNPCESCEYRRKQGCTSYWMKDAISVIEELQAEIERLQPKNGKWIEIESQTGVGAFGFNEVTVNAFRCSECRKKIDVSDGNFKYCPYCGAEMGN